MNFALLGDDPAVLPVVRALADGRSHRLTHAVHVGPLQAELMATFPTLRIVADCRDLPHDDALNAAIVCGSNPDLLDAARELAASGKRLLVLPRYGQGTEFAYRLTLIRDDAHVPLFPAFSLRFEPAVSQFAEAIESGNRGRLLELRLERQLARTSDDSGPAVLSGPDVDEALFHDVDLLRRLGGDYDQVTAFRSGATAHGFTRSTVTLAGDHLPEAIWTVSAAHRDEWQLTATCENGCGRLTRDENGLHLSWDNPARIESPAVSTSDQPAALLHAFENVAAGLTETPNWNDATRAFDVVDATHRSIQRRRTIDLHFETTSERMIFKSQMTALGCGVLIVTLLGLLLYLLVAGLFDVDKRLLQVLRVLWLLPLLLFLGLQLLLFVTRPSARDARSERDADGD